MKKKPFNYFFLNGDAHKKLHIDRTNDRIVAWNYPLGKRVVYNYSDVRRNMQEAFTTNQVAKMLMRHHDVVHRAAVDGSIHRPQMTYGLDENRNPFKYLWREENIMELYNYFKTIHRGHPRKDGMITPQRMPTERELRALIRNQTVFYVQTEDGEFRPTWEANF